MDENKSTSEEKMRKMIDDQSNQMLSLVDISNAHSSENEILKNKIKELQDDNIRLKKAKESLKEIFNLQSLLFTLLVLLLFWLFYCSK